MAKLKIRKLVKDLQTAQTRLNDVTGMLAIIAHRSGGEVSFSEDELKTLPEATFAISKKEGNINLTLNYIETPA